jgi:hypothetical protein
MRPSLNNHCFAARRSGSHSGHRYALACSAVPSLPVSTRAQLSDFRRRPLQHPSSYRCADFPRDDQKADCPFTEDAACELAGAPIQTGHAERDGPPGLHGLSPLGDLTRPSLPHARCCLANLAAKGIRTRSMRFCFEAQADYQTLNPRPWPEPGKLGGSHVGFRLRVAIQGAPQLAETALREARPAVHDTITD